MISPGEFRGENPINSGEYAGEFRDYFLASRRESDTPALKWALLPVEAD